MTQELLRLEDLTVNFREGNVLRPVLDRASLRIMAGETTALVGESGSGKTLLARTIMGLLPQGAEIAQGRLWFRGKELDLRDPGAFRGLQGRDIGLIFQEPLSSLNPALRIGLQLTEGLRFHERLSAADCRRQALEMLERVQITNPEAVLGKYPHEISGGMRQRVMIAAALMMKPGLLVADEPTTALDMIVQEEVLLLLKSVARDLGTAVLLITHDLSAVALLADHASVMNKGAIVEAGSVATILAAARDPYTRKLLAATPQPKTDDDAGPPMGEKPVVEVRDLCVDFPAAAGFFGLGRRETRVLDHVSFSVAPAETLAIIGESGSGKTTLSRCVAGLQTPSSGDIRFAGRNLQFVFQDPFGSLDPRMRVGDIITEGLLLRSGLTTEERRDKARAALVAVDLGPDCLDRFPHQLSGGQRQRVSIARAIIMNPDFILADEPVSALDLTVQKQVLDLLLALKAEIGFACLFVSHDLGVVEHIADRVGVLYRGRLVEIGPRAAIFNRPRHPYTCALLSARGRLVPAPDGSYSLERHRFTAETMPGGEPGYREFEGGHLVAVGP